MKVPLLDLKAQLGPLRSSIFEAITEVVDSTQYILGSKVAELESKIAAYSGCDMGVGVSSGTDALLLSLMVLGAGAAHRIITTPFSFFATAGVIARVGALPVLVDIDPETYNLSPLKLEEFLSQDKTDSRLLAAIPVHLYGQMADMDPIIELCRERGIAVIEDAAQAVGAEYLSKNGAVRAGAIGEMGCFSFFPSKNLGGMGDSGMVVTRDRSLGEKLRLYRTHGAQPKYYHRYVGGNFRMDPLQAAILLVKLEVLESWHRARRNNAELYDVLFESTGLTREHKVVCPARAWQDKGLKNPHIFNQYVIRIKEGRRDALKEHLGRAEVSTEIYYPVPFHLQECFRHLGYRRGDFPEAEAAAQEVLALPIYPELTYEMQEYVVHKILEFFQN
jgi:dTDP-4-amino-4,6-dideoxygalactose transaminase